MANLEGTAASVEQRTAYVLLRAAMGVNFLGHGVSRLLHGNSAFAQGMVKQMAETPLPSWLVYGFGSILPSVETSLGLLLLLGVFTRWTLTVGGVLMLVLMWGITLEQNFATAGSQLTYCLIFSILLFLRSRYDAGWLELVRG